MRALRALVLASLAGLCACDDASRSAERTPQVVAAPAAPAKVAVESKPPPRAPSVAILAKTLPRASISKEAVRRVIHRNIGDVRACAEQDVERTPSFQGGLGMQFLIDPSGRISAAEASDPKSQGSSYERCVLQAMRKWEFPKPDSEGYVYVTYPFLIDQTGE